MYEDSGIVCDAAASVISLRVESKASRSHAMCTILEDIKTLNAVRCNMSLIQIRLKSLCEQLTHKDEAFRAAITIELFLKTSMSPDQSKPS